MIVAYAKTGPFRHHPSHLSVLLFVSPQGPEGVTEFLDESHIRNGPKGFEDLHVDLLKSI